MKLEDQVCSLDPSKKLKELGVRQESLFEWTEVFDSEHQNKSWVLFSKDICDTVNQKASAFTVAELGEMLPAYLDGKGILRCEKGSDGKWTVEYELTYGELETCEDTEANARAKMLIYLIEQGIVKP